VLTTLMTAVIWLTVWRCPGRYPPPAGRAGKWHVDVVAGVAQADLEGAGSGLLGRESTRSATPGSSLKFLRAWSLETYLTVETWGMACSWDVSCATSWAVAESLRYATTWTSP